METSNVINMGILMRIRNFREIGRLSIPSHRLTHRSIVKLTVANHTNMFTVPLPVNSQPYYSATAHHNYFGHFRIFIYIFTTDN